MVKFHFKEDKHGFICEPFVDKPVGFPEKEDLNFYKCGWGKSKRYALNHCKERNGWK